MTATPPRLLHQSPAVLYIVYTPGPDAEANGYDPWLVRVDNPFFNAIPGVHHYANWKIEQVLHGAPPLYTYFDFQGVVAESDLERVWFNPDLDAFRREWIRLWGYGTGTPSPAQSNAYLMRPVHGVGRVAGPFARIAAGQGEPPEGADRSWRVEETIRKHFQTAGRRGEWRVPAAQDNPLGFDWVSVTYGDTAAELAAGFRPAGEALVFVARLIAAPP